LICSSNSRTSTLADVSTASTNSSATGVWALCADRRGISALKLAARQTAAAVATFSQPVQFVQTFIVCKSIAKPAATLCHVCVDINPPQCLGKQRLKQQIGFPQCG
jgi:hypothetical protein